MELNKFIAFEEYITPSAISIVWIIGAIIITLLSLGFMLFGFMIPGMAGSSNTGSAAAGVWIFLMGLVYLVFGNLFWRMSCEFVIVVFKINDNIEGINLKTPAKQ